MAWAGLAIFAMASRIGSRRRARRY
jgi:hypothetical protein